MTALRDKNTSQKHQSHSQEKLTNKTKIVLSTQHSNRRTIMKN